MHSYFELIRVKPHRWELDALRKIDVLYLRSRVENTGDAVRSASGLGAVIRGRDNR